MCKLGQWLCPWGALYYLETSFRWVNILQTVWYGWCKSRVMVTKNETVRNLYKMFLWIRYLNKSEMNVFIDFINQIVVIAHSKFTEWLIFNLTSICVPSHTVFVKENITNHIGISKDSIRSPQKLILHQYHTLCTEKWHNNLFMFMNGW